MIVGLINETQHEMCDVTIKYFKDNDEIHRVGTVFCWLSCYAVAHVDH